MNAPGAAALALLAAAPLAAQAPAPPSRDRLAAAYLQVEYLLRDHPPAAAALPDIHRAADRAGLAFLGGQGAVTLHVLDSLASALAPTPAAAVAAYRAALRTVDASTRRTRRLVVGTDTLPYQLHVPAGASGPFPVVVALHGAGGDERMFMDGNGAGRLRTLADERGFLVVAPFTNRIMRRPDLLEALLDTVAATHPFDRSQVWLLGHSLGAAAAWRLATARPEAYAAVVCVAGPCGGPPPDTSARWRAMPPTLVIAAALDPVAMPARLEPPVAVARAAGVPIEYRLVPDAGHTLVIGAVLPDAVAWLMAHRRAAP